MNQLLWELREGGVEKSGVVCDSGEGVEGVKTAIEYGTVE